jgi:hypothetical protein
MTEIRIDQSAMFRRAYKKLHSNQKADVDDAVAIIVKNPALGEAKNGDLAGIFVYKFKCNGQLTLLAYKLRLRNHQDNRYIVGVHCVNPNQQHTMMITFVYCGRTQYAPTKVFA